MMKRKTYSSFSAGETDDRKEPYIWPENGREGPAIHRAFRNIFFMPSFYIINNREKQTFPAGIFNGKKRSSGAEKRRKKTNEGKICFFSIIEI